MATPKFGGSELFEERDDVERPVPSPGQVLVRVLATTTNPIDTKLRADSSFAGLEPPVILGADVSEVIEEVGQGVEDLALGDEVYYTPEIFGPGSNGAYAEYNVAAAGGEIVVDSIPAALRAYRHHPRRAGGLRSPLPEEPGPLRRPSRERARLDEMSYLIERGQMKPLVDEVLTLDEVGKAQERLESGHGRGKIALRVA